ncbi:MAG: hypothetical protein Q9187_009092, partial [Circinaria calcarea]
MPIGEIGDAFRMVQTGKQVGKVVLEGNESYMVKIIDTKQPEIKLDGNATYVITGGLGDLGQRLCRMMVSKGARHVLALSRRGWEPDKHQEIEDMLHLIAAGSKFYSKTCDIIDAAQVKKVISSFATMGLPPVKGVVQAAMSLQDCTLQKMTLYDFQIPLQTKLYGTRHLSKAFQSSPLDFFLVLSSAAGIVGTSGQANYNAGNNFQDAFANAQADPNTHYMSLDIGMVEDAHVNNKTRERSLRRQGLDPIKPDELLAFLEYAMSAEASRECCKQAIVGFDERSLSQVNNPNAASQTAIFSHIWRSIDNKTCAENVLVSKSFQENVSVAGDMEEISRIITTAIAQKISSLVTFNQQEMNLERSMTELGLDSLIAIELKNWITQEFQAVVQISEILDQESIIALAAMVASSSTVVKEALEKLSNQNDKHQSESAGKSRLSGLADTDAKLHNIRIPQLPVPDLDSTLQLYLNSVRVFLSREEFEQTSKAIKEFQEPGGLGQELQKRLVTRSRHNDDGMFDLYAAIIYLKRRDPIHPFLTFYGGHLLGNVSHSQAQRAAILSAAAFTFKQQLDAGTMDQDYMNEEPL